MYGSGSTCPCSETSVDRNALVIVLIADNTSIEVDHSESGSQMLSSAPDSGDSLSIRLALPSWARDDAMPGWTPHQPLATAFIDV